jgi:hypothetical protein
MPATLLATIPAPQQILSGEDHQPIFEVIILTLFKRFWLVTLVARRIHFVFYAPFCG